MRDTASPPYPPAGLDIWTVYARPSDYPDGFVARKFVNFKPSSQVVTGSTLDEVRDAIQDATPYVLSRIERAPSDDPPIVECWL